jgi:hypothetical protein
MSTALDLTSIKPPLDKLQREMTASLIERDEVIRASLVTLLARQHMIVLGPPGTAKSALVTSLAERISPQNGAGLRSFAYLMTRFTTPDEITSITAGTNIERLLPSEIALLADPDLEDLFYLKFAEHNLMQYDLIGHEPEGQGPIIIAIDESGSMMTDYGGMTGEVWSKAVMLALLSIARLQKRDLAVLHPGIRSSSGVKVLPRGGLNAQIGEIIS